MPMDFPDLQSLEFAAQVHKFRKKRPDESEDEYREALAVHVEPRDSLEAEEIRFKVGWDKFTDEQRFAILARHGL